MVGGLVIAFDGVVFQLSEPVEECVARNLETNAILACVYAILPVLLCPLSSLGCQGAEVGGDKCL